MASVLSIMSILFIAFGIMYIILSIIYYFFYEAIFIAIELIITASFMFMLRLSKLIIEAAYNLSLFHSIIWIFITAILLIIPSTILYKDTIYIDEAFDDIEETHYNDDNSNQQKK